MSDFVAHTSRWRVALLILIAAGFVVLGSWMVGAFGPPPTSRRYSSATIFVIGWFSVAFFGLCGLVGLKRLVTAGEQLRVNGQGVRSSAWSDQTIPWSEITDVTTWNYKGQKAIVLHLRDPAKFPGRGIAAILAGANRKLTGGDVSVSMTGTDRSFDDAMSAIECLRP